MAQAEQEEEADSVGGQGNATPDDGDGLGLSEVLTVTSPRTSAAASMANPITARSESAATDSGGPALVDPAVIGALSG